MSYRAPITTPLAASHLAATRGIAAPRDLAASTSLAAARSLAALRANSPVAKRRGLLGLGDAAADKRYWNAMAQACTQMADEGTCLSRVARHVPVTIVPGFGGLGGMTPTQRRLYWQGMANGCKQYADEGACLARISRRTPVTISSGFGQVQTLAPQQTLGVDRTRTVIGSQANVDARWAQRGVNAGRAYNGTGQPLLFVDGQSGPLTLAGLQDLSHQFSGGAPVSNNPASARVASRVLIPVQLEQRLQTLPLPQDPPRPSSSTTTSTTTTRSTTTAPSTGAKPGAPGAPATDTSAVVGVDSGGQAVLVDEGSSGTPAWLVPALVVGGVVVAGTAGLVLWGRSRAAAARPSAPRPVARTTTMPASSRPTVVTRSQGASRARPRRNGRKRRRK